jgi:GH43 family beta-xylosidase
MSAVFVRMHSAVRCSAPVAIALALALFGQSAAAEADGYFTNPLLPSGPDPWVVRDGSIYYYMHTLGDRLAIWKTRDITDLAHAQSKTIWMPPAHGLNAVSIWAPELHRIGGKWFIYYTAAASGHDDDSHRGIFVLENVGLDPLAGEWIDRGRLNTRYPGIDATTFEHDGSRYFAYSAYISGDSVLAIAPMAGPLRLSAPEIIIARPDFSWERQGGRRILEGPEFLVGPKGDVFLTYSASACWSDDYALGLLHARPGADLLDPHAWVKSPGPVFSKSPANGVFAPGHNGFFTSADGHENWIIYHANSAPGWGCTGRRAPRIQAFPFDSRGFPMFGQPVASLERLKKPATR